MASVQMLTFNLRLIKRSEPGKRNRCSDWLRAGRPRSGSSSPGRVKNFLQVVQTGSGANPTSYQWVQHALSPGVKRPVREADNSPPSSAEVKKAWAYTIDPPFRLHGVAIN
jgi:hypothetical protein